MGIREQLQFNQTQKTAQKQSEKAESQAFVELTNQKNYAALEAERSSKMQQRFEIRMHQ